MAIQIINKSNRWPTGVYSSTFTKAPSGVVVPSSVYGCTTNVDHVEGAKPFQGDKVLMIDVKVKYWHDILVGRPHHTQLGWGHHLADTDATKTKVFAYMWGHNDTFLFPTSDFSDDAKKLFAVEQICWLQVPNRKDAIVIPSYQQMSKNIKISDFILFKILIFIFENSWRIFCIYSWQLC